MSVFILLILLLAIDLYAFQAVRTVFDTTPWFRNPAALIYWSVSLGIYALILLGIFRYYGLSLLWQRIILGSVVCIGIGKLFAVSFVLIDDVVRLARWVPTLFYSGPQPDITPKGISRSQFLNTIALITGGLMTGMFTWGMVRTAYSYRVLRERLNFPKLPAGFGTLKVVQISDLHLGSFLNPDPLRQAVDMINGLEADLVFFTGDMVNSVAAEAGPFVDTLSGIRARYGVFSVLGNHDYGSYHRWDSEAEARANLQRLRDIHAACGWTLLDNDNRLLEINGATVAVIGVENWGHSDHFPKLGDLDRACAGTEQADLRLLLSHDPSHWDFKVTEERPDVDITFSGHTHGFQMGVEIPSLNIKWSPSKYVYRHWAGLYQRSGQYLYVNRGLGFIGYHGRVGIPPEITLMEISGEDA